MKILLFHLLLVFHSAIVFGQSGGAFAVTQSVVAGGEGNAVGGILALETTVGQPLTLGAASGGTVVVSSGFWNNTSMAPTAANVSVSGRLSTSDGRGIRSAVIYLANASTGEIRSARSSAFGYYRFEDIPVGVTYIIRVTTKRFQFVPDTQVIALLDELTELNFTAEP